MKSWNSYLGLIAAVSWFIISSGCSHQVNTNAAVASAAPPANVERVSIAKPQRKTLIVQTALPARINAFEQTPLYSKLAGYVERVHADIGDRVSQGAPLITLSIPELRDDVAQQEASVAYAGAEVAQAQANVDAAQAAVKTAQAKIAEAEATIGAATGDVARSESEHARIKQLAESGSVTDKLADEALNKQRSAAASRDASVAARQSAEAVAQQAEANVRKAKADQLAAEARRHVAQANLAHAQTMLGYAVIKAPYDCVVTHRDVDTGNFVQPAGGAGAKPLLVVVRADKVRVSIEVPEMNAALVDVGDPVSLRVQALPGKELTAAVARTSWSLDDSNRSLRTEIDLANDAFSLRPGMFATATITLERRENALTIPVTAIFRVGDDAFCSCIESGKIQRHRVELGVRSGPDVEVLRGIDDNATVVATRGDAVPDGHPVQIIAPKE